MLLLVLVLVVLVQCGLTFGATSVGATCLISQNQSIKAKSCRQLKYKCPNCASGEYYLRIKGKKVKAYCEFNIGGNAFTFIHPNALSSLTNAQIQKSRYCQASAALLRFKLSDGNQSYVIIKQLPAYNKIGLYAGVDATKYYKPPTNAQSQYLGSPYFYLGVIPSSLITSKGTTEGFVANGVTISFSSCDANPSSYFATFPNRTSPVFITRKSNNINSQWGHFTYYPVCRKLLNTFIVSKRTLPLDYFMLAEVGFGGCGCYAQTDSNEIYVRGMAIGYM